MQHSRINCNIVLILVAMNTSACSNTLDFSLKHPWLIKSCPENTFCSQFIIVLKYSIPKLSIPVWHIQNCKMCLCVFQILWIPPRKLPINKHNNTVVAYYDITRANIPMGETSSILASMAPSDRFTSNLARILQRDLSTEERVKLIIAEKGSKLRCPTRMSRPGPSPAEATTPSSFRGGSRSRS